MVRSLSSQAPESSKAAEPHRPIEVAAGDSTAKPDVPASVAQQNQARDGKSDLPLRVDGTDATLEELLSESRCAWRWCNGRGAEGVSLLEVWEGIQTAPGAWAFALDTSRAIEPGTTGPPEVVMPQLRGDIDTRSSSSSIAGPRGWALALPKPPASEAQGLLPSAVYYVPFQASGSCPGLVLWRAAMGSSAAAGRTASNSSSLKVTCDLKQQLLSLMQPGLGDAAATIGEQVVDVRIAEWVLQPDSTARVSDKLGPGSKKNHYLVLFRPYYPRASGLRDAEGCCVVLAEPSEAPSTGGRRGATSGKPLGQQPEVGDSPESRLLVSNMASAGLPYLPARWPLHERRRPCAAGSTESLREFRTARPCRCVWLGPGTGKAQATGAHAFTGDAAGATAGEDGGSRDSH